MYKKIIIVTAGRINLSDKANNGLLFRNLFRSWPKDKIGQIYNSGNNHDDGFFSLYYKLTEKDRRFGKLYEKIYIENTQTNQLTENQFQSKNYFRVVMPYLKKLLIETGIYELFFRPKLSSGLKIWLNDFKPDLILAQGYSLTFTELSLLIKNYTGSQLVFFTTDDWPKYLYNGNLGENRFLSLIPRLRVENMVKKLLQEVDIPIAFGYPMQLEYSRRYSKQFYSVFHSDDHKRFETAEPKRLANKDTFSIVTIGTFNKFRWPLLNDLEQCCEVLNLDGIEAKVFVISDAIDPDGLVAIKQMKNVEVRHDPGSDKLPGLLKGADLLLLIEGFDNDYANTIELSISTKAHLYMFSKVPILVYSHPTTGISNYAQKYGWAYLVNDRNLEKLTDAIKNLLSNKILRENLSTIAYKVAMENHDQKRIEKKLFQILHLKQ